MADFGYAMTRYADDPVIQCSTCVDAQWALELVRTWSAEHDLMLQKQSRPKSRMRELSTAAPEGGGAEPNRASLSYRNVRVCY
ncbi:MAG: hypothetical protein Fues2KO_45210 [Fuerstiella sp.]